jgi:hypothetical protein
MTRAKRLGTRCYDCKAETLSLEPGVSTEYYMVRAEVWNAAGMERGYLCIGCLETRIGRQLHRRDFARVPLNDISVKPTPRYAWSYRSKRLLDRLTAPSPEDGIQLALWGEMA